MSIGTDPITFTVLGKAQPAGSKSSFVPCDKNGNPYRGSKGRIVVNTVDSNKHAKSWQQEIKSIAREAYDGPLLTCPLRVSFLFVRVRSPYHFGKNGLNKKGRENPHPTTRPDLLKLARAVEDSLSKVIYLDDSQIVQELLEKRWGEPSRVEVTIEPIVSC